MRPLVILAIAFVAGFACMHALRSGRDSASGGQAVQAPARRSSEMTSAACQSAQRAILGPIASKADASAKARPAGIQDWSYRVTQEGQPSFDESRYAAIVFEIGKQRAYEQHPDLALLMGPERFEQLARLWAELKRVPAVLDSAQHESYLNTLGVVDGHINPSLATDEIHTLARLRQQVPQALDDFAARELDYYVKTLHTRRALEPVRAALQREHLVLSSDEVEDLVFAEATAVFEASSQWQGVLTSEVPDYDHATELIELKVRRILEQMAPKMSAERLRALERALQRRARHQTLDVAKARAAGWGFLPLFTP